MLPTPSLRRQCVYDITETLDRWTQVFNLTASCFTFCRNSSAAIARKVAECGKVRPRFVQSLSACSSSWVRLSAERRRTSSLRHFRHPDHARRPCDVIDDTAAASFGADGHGRVDTAEHGALSSPPLMNTVNPLTGTLKLQSNRHYTAIR